MTQTSNCKVVAALAMLLLGACTRTPPEPRVAAFSALPDWTGIWRMDAPVVGLDGFPFIEEAPSDATTAEGAPLAVFNLNAPLSPEGRARVLAIIGESRGNPVQTPQGSDGWGFPLMMHSPPPLQFVITPEETLIFNGYRDMRRIYTDGRGRPPEEDRWPPTTWGDSVGRWEGDTLVIETIDVREPREYFGLSMPFTSKARYTERLRKVGPDRIEGEMVIEDPGLLAAPMTVQLAYVRETMLDRLVLDSFGTDRTGFDGEFNTIEGPASGASAVAGASVPTRSGQ